MRTSWCINRSCPITERGPDSVHSEPDRIPSLRFTDFRLPGKGFHRPHPLRRLPLLQSPHAGDEVGLSHSGAQPCCSPARSVVDPFLYGGGSPDRRQTFRQPATSHQSLSTGSETGVRYGFRNPAVTDRCHSRQAFGATRLSSDSVPHGALGDMRASVVGASGGKNYPMSDNVSDSNSP